MRQAKIFMLTILVSVLTITGCAAKPTSNQTTDTHTSTEATAKVNSESQKAQEKAYYDAVKSGTTEVTTAMGKMNSLMGDYDSSKAKDLSNTVVDITKKVEKVALIDPPPGYEHVQTLYKQGADSLIKSMFTLTDALDKSDSSKIDKGLKDMGQATSTMVQAINEMKNILTSHGISY